ncbi:tripartite motif-containing protein 54 [Chelydra serpentina]|uniref:Tripartite motif-containing protein 54 n=1 Tax=Chelydra serpentina TaxID=8475 RepID=A0A8T1TAS3_CHESE|nr:tripartite motif-containing protein 54 [Chelydra serpentina]
MEALGEALSCPVCLELFTPPVLVLTCAHNFCKPCLEKILIRQNCSHVNGQFCCPMCRKVTYLRGRGIIGLPRNILVESILEKFKDELENIRAQEQNQLSQICEEHGENMNLMCLTDDEPICAICKLFGNHEHHNIDLLLQKSEGTGQSRKETEKLISELVSSTTDTKVMIDTVGISLLKGIRCRIAELKTKLHMDYSTKLEKLHLVESETEAPRQLYQQMKTLLEQHSNSVQFLQEDKKLRSKMEKLIEGRSLNQDPSKYKISVRRYFEELIRGFNIKEYISTTSDEMLASTSDLYEACRPECPAFAFSGESPDQSFCKRVLGLFEKSGSKE